MSNPHLILVGAGPAGLAAAYESVTRGLRPIVLEKAHQVGGMARTEVYKAYRFDIGGHRFYTKASDVEALWKTMLGDDLATVARLSRIYYQGRFFDYPLSLRNTLLNLGFIESCLILLSYLRTKLRPLPEEDTFEQWVTNRFGHRLFETFFQTYTEKVWGIPCNQIQAEWAMQRIQGLSLTAAVSNALFGANNAKSLIKHFLYPILGPGMMWQRFGERVEGGGGEIRLDHEVIRLEHEQGRIRRIVARTDETTAEMSAEHYISSMPLGQLVARLDPPPPADVQRAARQLNYRSFAIVGLIVNQAELFPDQWIYVHSPGVRVGRIQNFGNWSAPMVPDAHKSSLGLEYFCTEGDDIWTMPDADLVQLATRELHSLQLADTGAVVDGVVFRQPKAYPVYDRGYRQHLEVIRCFLDTIENLQTIGRNGMHRYNNMDHSMLTGMLAVRNLLGEEHDLWQVNTENVYYEQATSSLSP
jgi:protoporphyrinogen oxidase